ncbi:tyrosine-type recombinase/integrase [Hyphomonas sp.]|uniref:tyrosine-type recombinase/integrase n=1 Tax=Hyphomonas sp. TaxID=87 RepID=UPI00391CE5A9
MPQNLTARFVETVKPKAGERTTISDSVVEGLELRLGTNGSKTWSLRYRTKSGKRSRLSLGRYPALSLAEARDRAIQALAAAVSGADPAKEKKIEKIEAIAADRSVQDLADAFFASPEAAQRTKQTNIMESGVWRNHLAPKLAKRPLHGLTRGEVRACVREVAQRSGNRTANYAQAVLRRIYNFGIREEWVEINPAHFPRLYPHKSRDRVFSEAEIRLLWETWSAARVGARLGVSEPIAIALQLCLTTLQRAGEVIGMHTDELDWTTRSWVIASERSKNRRAHHVPLSPLSQQLIRRTLALATATEVPGDIDAPLPRLVANYRGPVFPAIHGNGPVDRHVVTRAMSRIREKLGIVNGTAHDLRRTGASMMASERCGVRGEVIARILNHTPLGSPVTQIYNRYDYAAEKRAALELWGETLLKITRPEQLK